MKYSHLVLLVPLLAIFFLFYFYFDNFYDVYSEFTQKAFIRNPSKKENLSEIDLEFGYDYSSMIRKYCLTESKLYGLPYFAGNNHDVHSFKELAHHWVNEREFKGFQAESVRCGQVVWVKTDYINDFFKNHHRKISEPYILMTQDSDYAVGHPDQLKYLNDSKIIAWFGQNAIGKHPKLKHLSIGIPLNYQSAPGKNNNFMAILELSKRPIPFHQRNVSLYVNISPDTNHVRLDVLNYFEAHYGNDSDVQIVTTRNTWEEYLLQMGQSQFVISPPGNGIDCYRTWEAMIMGAVPIVSKNDIMPLFEGMPIMVVQNWTEVTRENLEKFKINELTNLSRDGIPWRPKIWLRYWIEYVEGVRLDYMEKHCYVTNNPNKFIS